MACSPDEMRDAIRNNCEAKTGQPFHHWVAVARRSGLTTPRACRDYLKREHGLGHVTAQLAAQDALQRPPARSKDLEATHFEGLRARFRPLYERIVEEARAIDPAVETQACKGYLGLRARRQFAVVKPTRSGLRIGLALGADASTELETAGALGGSDRITHQLLIEAESQINGGFRRLLKQAHGRGG